MNHSELHFEPDNDDLSEHACLLVYSGQVQGVGFRPFIYRLAQQHQLKGTVRNCLGLVEIFIQGNGQNKEQFINDVLIKKPPIAQAVLESQKNVPTQKLKEFSILPSLDSGEKQVHVPVDLFLCDDCLQEMYDPANRRYQYPFINCTQCGPRFTLIKHLPYDRANTSMKAFDLCPDCSAEYENPLDRRFHAEPIACPQCGPQLEFTSSTQNTHETQKAIHLAVELLKDGKIIALKGIGGYHLLCDAQNTHAIQRLRENKSRPHKPLAVMFPAPSHAPFEAVQKAVYINAAERNFISSPSRPILLLTKLSTSTLSPLVAPGLNEIGVMLAYSPLHHLLLNAYGGPLVATSANISGEPVLTEKNEVELRLNTMADGFLHHNREIVRPADDPVYRPLAGKNRLIRAGRGNAPLEINLPFELTEPVLALGTQMKNTIALGWGNRVVISPHIGEMDSARSLEVFEKNIQDLQQLYNVKAKSLLCDAHPDYSSTRWARKQTKPVHKIYHHHAHASAVYAESGISGSMLMFSWDGVGLGEDNTLWGGETFIGQPANWQRVASMRPFHLPGGDKAGRQPWRSAAALCWEAGQSYPQIPIKDPLLKQAWQRRINTPQSTSVGRLFDAAAALTGLCVEASFEGQGPMLLEALCRPLTEQHINGEHIPSIALNLIQKDGLLCCDWEPLLKAMQNNHHSLGYRASLFHASLAQNILKIATIHQAQSSIQNIGFSGGVFQNRILTEYAQQLLVENGFKVFIPEQIPVNDAAISFGQIIEFLYRQKV